MRKLILSFAAGLIGLGSASAQSDCNSLMPKEKGSVMITKCYDGKDNLVATTKYTVKEYNENQVGSNSQISFAVTNASGKTIGNGTLEAYCENGSFFMKAKNALIDPSFDQLLSSNINLVGGVLDYPDTFNKGTFEGPFQMESGEFIIEPKGDRKHMTRVSIYNREYKKNEKVTTPAGTFDAAKITYNVDVYSAKDKTTLKLKNIEWYAFGYGIVRSESYNKNHTLEYYTVLSEYTEK